MKNNEKTEKEQKKRKNRSLTVFGLGRQRPPELVDEFGVEHVQRRRGRQLGRRRRRRRGLGGALQAGLRVARRVPGRDPVVLLAAGVVESRLLGHAAQRPMGRRRADHEVAAGRRGQRRALRGPGAAVQPSAARGRRRSRRFVVRALGHAPVTVRFVNVVIVFYDGHHESHSEGKTVVVVAVRLCAKHKQKSKSKNEN